MKSEELVFTDFNFSFITFPRQVFVGFFHVVFQKGGNAVRHYVWFVMYRMKCRKKLDVDCVVMEEMLFGVRLCIVLQRKKCR